MKKILFIALSLSVLILFFSSCKDEEDVYSPGMSFGVSDANYYSLDPGVSGKLTVSEATGKVVVTLVAGPDSTKIGNKIAELDVTDGVANYTFINTDLGLYQVGSSATLEFSSTTSGGVAVAHNIEFSCNDPLTITEKMKYHTDTVFNQDDSTLIDSVFYLSPYLTDSVKYELAENCTAPTSVSITRHYNDSTPVAVVNPQASGYLVESFDTALNKVGDSVVYDFEYSNANGVVKKKYTIIISEIPELSF